MSTVGKRGRRSNPCRHEHAPSGTILASPLHETGEAPVTSDCPRRGAWLERVAAAIAIALAVGSCAVGALGGSSPASHRWTFSEDVGSADVSGLGAGASPAGGWIIEHDQSATGARSIVSRIGERHAAPAALVTSDVRARDVRAATRCRPTEDSEAGACGLVFRYVDDKTHHVARVDTSRQVVLARVGGGAERVLASGRSDVGAGIWHELSVEARGDAIRVVLNGQTVIDTRDVRPAPIGAVGLWAPSACEAYFDELTVDVFPTALQTLEMLPILPRRTS